MALVGDGPWIVPESVSERLALADELVALGREGGLPYVESDGHQWRFMALVELGKVTAADETLAAARAAARTARSHGTVWFLSAARALLAGRLEDAEAAAVRAREAQAAAGSPVAQSAFVRLMGCIRLVQGRLTEIEQSRRAMAEGVTSLPPTFFVVKAHAARERDDRDGARQAFSDALAPGLLELPRGPVWTISLIWAADICAWLEDCARAAQLYDLLAPFPNVVTWQYGPVGRPVAGLARLLGRGHEAEQLLRDAVSLCERIEARAFLAMARCDLGELLLPAPAGRRLLDEARAAADELGMSGLAKRAGQVSMTERHGEP